VDTGTEDGHVTQTCAPIADFKSANIEICQGAITSLKDLSWGGDVVSRVWSFPGGTPATDTSATASVSYALPGTYDVTLTVTNSGGSSTLTRNAQIHVFPNPGVNTLPYSEGFETVSFPGADWTVENPDNNNAWTLTAAAAASGVKSVRLINQTGNASGSKDIFVSPTYNLTNKVGTSLTFKVAYAMKAISDSSALKVYATNNCGTTWTLRYTKRASSLQTSGPTSNSFVPTAAEWRTETVSLTSSQFSGQASVRLKFEFDNDFGNNIYIDDINLNAGTVGFNELLAEQYSFKAWPVPAHDQLQVQLSRDVAESVRIELFDMTGRKVDETLPSEKASGPFQTTISSKNYDGMYILKVTSGSKSFQQRVNFIQ
jgi:PKD repeat protein